MCQAVNDIGMDIKMGETGQSDLNFVEDTHVEIHFVTCNTKTASTIVTHMKQQPACFHTKTKPSDKYV